MENYKEGYISQEAASSLINCLDFFDFEKCHEIMKFLNWEWAGYGIPEANDIKEKAKQHLLNAYNSFYNDKSNGPYPYTVVSGGLEATYKYDEEVGHIFTLKFVAIES